MKPFKNLIHAVRAATTPCGIAYVQNEGWLPYDLTEGCKVGKPDFLWIQGQLPVPLNDAAADSLESMVKAYLA